MIPFGQFEVFCPWGKPPRFFRSTDGRTLGAYIYAYQCGAALVTTSRAVFPILDTISGWPYKWPMRSGWTMGAPV